MTPASMVGMPKSPRSMAFSAAAAPFGERRKARFCVAASGRDEQHQPALPSMAAVPASLRAIQAKRKVAAARGVPRASSAAGCAVAALAAAVEAVQGAAVGGASGAARGAGDAVAWVFQKVHFESPDLAVGLLGLVASCLGTAVEMEMERMRAREAEASARKTEPVASAADAQDDDHCDDAEEADDVPMLVGLDLEKELWARIGIQHGDDDDNMPPMGVDEDEQEAINIARAELRKASYERIIATSEANSLILSNYAQLLYEFDKDLDRAEDYFKRAVAIEPPDGEAMRRYGMFLWQARGDLVGAEDMFTGAIDEDPDSSHHRSSYAWFLWMTGGVETCVIDSGSNNDPE
ncbi:uncharacterized protein LOC124647560 [Lolium rigidum]|uniref:uncharacterized protein LOC124647560 n=1 Tax=Lolium rigidum TaxID=89674 RepID=UPI001F5D8204|nr:uncharacterized protein LOC124647560 [Lolium rigidum]